LWFERAEKVLKQLDHLALLIEFLEYVATISHRFHQEYIPMLKDSSEGGVRKVKLIKEMRAMMELYSAYQIDYDYFDHNNKEKFSLFKVNSSIHQLGKLRKKILRT
jgi:3-dehydroquinate dehydratase